MRGRAGRGPWLGVALSLALHGMAVAAALTWRQSDPRPFEPAIAVTLVTPRAMPPPARLPAPESTAGPERAAPVAPVPADSVAPVSDPAPSPTAARPRPLEHVARDPDDPGRPAPARPETHAPAAPAPAAAREIPGAPSMAPAERRLTAPLDLAALPTPPAGRAREPAATTPPGRTAPKFEGAGLANPLPRYPYLARRRGQEGRVVLRVLVSETGVAKAVSIRRPSGYRLLDEAALKAIRAWRFVPARRAGIPVAGALDVPVSFRLNE